MKALLVGAGAVGQVYGRHLARGGAAVTFYVKPKYADAARSGFVLYPLNDKRAQDNPTHFTDLEVVTDMAAVGEASWDLVLLCVSSTALRKGTWVDELAAAIGDAHVVSFAPGLVDHAFLCERFDPERIINGAIALSSYAAPLPNEEVPEPGTAYWVPPLTKLPFSGPPEVTKSLVATLRRGGMPAKVTKDARVTTAFGGAILNTQMIALECAGWSFDRLDQDRELSKLGFASAKEALAIASKQMARKPPLAMRMLRRWQLRLFTRLARRMAPMDLETFFRVHYTKVGDQGRFIFDSYISLGQEHGIPTPALGALRERLREVQAARAPEPS